MIKINMEMPESCFKCRFLNIYGSHWHLASGFWNWSCMANDGENFLIPLSEFDPCEKQEEIYSGCQLIECENEIENCDNCKYDNEKDFDTYCLSCESIENGFSEWKHK